MSFLITYPPVRVNDCFVSDNSNFDFSIPEQNFFDPIVEGSPNISHRFQSDFYKKIGVDIVTETVFNYPYPFITEKTYRPIASLRPFIIVGPYGTLKFIKDLGFVTFSDIMDERYDNVKNPELRFDAVCKTIKNFVCRPIVEIQSDLCKIKEDLKFNQIHLSNLIKIELEKFKAQL